MTHDPSHRPAVPLCTLVGAVCGIVVGATLNGTSGAVALVLVGSLFGWLGGNMVGAPKLALYGAGASVLFHFTVGAVIFCMVRMDRPDLSWRVVPPEYRLQAVIWFVTATDFCAGLATLIEWMPRSDDKSTPPADGRQ